MLFYEIHSYSLIISNVTTIGVASVTFDRDSPQYQGSQSDCNPYCDHYHKIQKLNN